MRPQHSLRFSLTCLAAAASALVTACGGGADTKAPPTTGVASVSQADATADAANATATGMDSATAFDTIVDATSAIAQATATAAAAQDGHAQVQSTDRQPQAGGITNVTVNCAGGGTATLSITGGTAASELNGQLDAGEHYSLSYAQCTGQAGRAQLTGSVEMDVLAADPSTAPASITVGVTATRLALSLPAGTATLDGSATLARTVATTGDTSVTTSHVTVPTATLATAFHARNGSFTLTDLDATRTVTTVAGVTSGSQYAGHHTLAGNANGRSFSMSVATSGNVSCDASGAPVAGAWTVVRPLYTLATTVANGLVVLTLDVGNDGSIERTWTFPLASLALAAG